MATGVAALHKAIVSAWNLTEILRSGMARPEDTLPYVVFQQQASNDVTRMSGPNDTKFKDTNVPIEFRCYAKSTASLTAKEAAADIADRVKRVYGGHPTVNPTSLTLDFGNAMWAQLTTEDDTDVGDDEHMWRLGYTFKLDIPVKI